MMKKEEIGLLDAEYEVCFCLTTTLGEVLTAIKEGCSSIEDLTDSTDVGMACELCQSREIDQEHEKELHLDEILSYSQSYKSVEHTKRELHFDEVLSYIMHSHA